MTQDRSKYILFFLVCIGLIVRLIFIVDQGLSNDELSAWLRTDYNNFQDLINSGVKTGDMHPAFYQVLLWFWVHIFGDTEFSMRSISLIFYVFSMIMMYRIGSQFYTKMSAILLVAMYVGLTFTIINTTFSRPYNSGVFFLLIAFYGILKIKKNEHINWKNIILIALGFAGAMYSHYFAFLAALTLGFTGLFYLKLRHSKQLLIAGLIAAILFLPHLSITLHQMSLGGLQWLAKPTFMWPIDFLYLFFNNSWWLVILIPGLVILNVALNHSKRITREQLFILAFPLITFIFAFFISHTYTPILRDIAMLFILPFLILGIFSFFPEKGKLVNFSCAVFLILPAADSFFRNDILGPNHFGVFKEVGNSINNAVDKYGFENISFASNYNNVEYLNYYLNKDVKESIIDWDKQDAINKLASRVTNAKTPFFIYSVNNKYHTPMFLEIIQRKYPIIRESEKYGNSEYFLFAKSGQTLLEKQQVANINQSFSASNNEFMAECRFPISQVKSWMSSDTYLKVSTQLKTENNSSVFLVATIERHGQILKNGTDPVLYVAYDQNIFKSQNDSSFLINAFNLPEDLDETDELKIYIWNPKMVQISIQDILIEAVCFNSVKN